VLPVRSVSGGDLASAGFAGRTREAGIVGAREFRQRLTRLLGALATYFQSEVA
jgi:hypothetical protein